MFDRALDRRPSRRVRRYFAAAIALLFIAPFVFVVFAVSVHFVVKYW